MVALRKNGRMQRALGAHRERLLLHAVEVVQQLLPHVTITASREADWSPPGFEVIAGTGRTRGLLRLGGNAPAASGQRALEIELRRLEPRVLQNASRQALDAREEQLCASLAAHVAPLIGDQNMTSLLCDALVAQFDEHLVAASIESHHGLRFDVMQMFRDVHRLAEQTYENKQIVFGCLIDPRLPFRKDVGARHFTTTFLRAKKYRALSDGVRTAYIISRADRLHAFGALELVAGGVDGGWHPSWAADLAGATIRSRGCGICLTRQGDILVFEEGTLRFSYRRGRWQYWNHDHLVDVITAICRRQKVDPAGVKDLARFTYAVALDVAFRRSGGLLVILKRRKDLRSIVRPGDAMSDRRRATLDLEFDRVLRYSGRLATDRRTLAELAGIDGAMVFEASGSVAAYGAILQPKRRGRVGSHEGSRTKAAIGASHFGLALKVSADGDMAAFYKGEEVFRV